MLRINQWLIYGLLLTGAVLMLFPFYWMVTTSLKSAPEAIQAPPTLVPENLSLLNYLEVFRRVPFARYAVNSIVMSLGITLGVVVTSSLAGYAFARIRFWGASWIFMLFLATMMIPPEVRLIPNFVLMNALDWTNTFQGLILPFAANVFSIFLMRQAYLSIPTELNDAAVLDGASQWQYFLWIATPLTGASLSVVALLAFLRSWNELLWPLIVTTSQDMRTLQLGLTTLSADIGTEFPLLMAAATLTVLPILILYLFTQRQFVEGVANTGIK